MMQAISSNIWAYKATASTEPLFLLDLTTGTIAGEFFDAHTTAYLEGTLKGFLDATSGENHAQIIEGILKRVISISPLTGEGALSVVVHSPIVEVSIDGMAAGDDLIIQIPHSTSLSLFAPPVVIPEPPPPPPSEGLGYKTVELGDASTGLWYVTLAARGTSAALFDVSILKNADLSIPGALGTFAIDVSNVEGLSIYSITAFTYTKAETQAKVLVVLDNPQGPRFAHEVARCSATQTTTNGSQSMTPTITVARSDGSIPAVNGVPHQLDPTESYPRLRVSAVGFTSATENVVTDPAFNKPQSLVVQF